MMGQPNRESATEARDARSRLPRAPLLRDVFLLADLLREVGGSDASALDFRIPPDPWGSLGVARAPRGAYRLALMTCDKTAGPSIRRHIRSLESCLEWG